MPIEDTLNTALNATSWVVNRGWDATKAVGRLAGQGIHRAKHYMDLALDPILATGLTAAAITKLAYLPYDELPDPTTGSGRLKLTLAGLGALIATVPAVYITGKYSARRAWRNVKRQQRFGEYPSIANYTKTLAGATLLGILYTTAIPTGDSLEEIIDTNTQMFQDTGSIAEKKPSKCSEPTYSSKKKEGLWTIQHATCKPVEGQITSHYGSRFNRRDFHEAVDIGCEQGQHLLALNDGKITKVKPNSGASGNWIAIELKDGKKTYTYTYSHMDTINVKKNQRVQAGSRVGTCGNTGHSLGPHLHLRLKKGTLSGQDQDPLKRAE